MSSDRISRRAAALGLLALGGCGFAPVYGDGSALRGLVTFQTDETVAGYRLRERLEQRLGVTQNARYELRVALSQNSQPAAITAAGDTVRFNVVGRADWSLRAIATGQIAAEGKSESFTSYAATGTTVATQAARTDATARLSVALADMIVSRLLILSNDLSQ